MRDHAADGAPEHLGRGAEVPGAAAGGVVAGLLAQEGLVLYCRNRSVSSGWCGWLL